MKSEIKNNRVASFLKENPFVNYVIIRNKNKTVFYPEVHPEKELFFRQVIDECMTRYAGDADCFMVTDKAHICILKRKKAVYVCETVNTVSVSQVKLELANFIENQEQQGTLSRLFSSFFDR